MKKKIKLLVFDLEPQNSAGADLHQLLAENLAPVFEMEHVKGGMTTKKEVTDASLRLASILASFSPDMTFLVLGTVLRSQASDLFAVVRAFKASQPVIMVVNTGEPAEIAAGLFYGANDFLIPPFRPLDVLPRIWRWVQEQQQEQTIQNLKEKLGLNQFVGESPTFVKEIKKIPAVAGCDASVLIAGETGTGKEICARAIHYLSARRKEAFVALNCGAIPTELLENELFGHESGAYTSATGSSIGLIREADGGTLFLDEIDSLPLLAQVKLLRFLQEREFRPLGSRKTCKANLRVIAASNANLEDAVEKGRFRRDLFYRLNVVPLSLPALRDRPGDVPLLARHFVLKFTVNVGKLSKSISAVAIQKLILYSWPGNVRELENVIERSLILSEYASIDGSDIVLPQTAAATGDESFQALKALAVADFERKYILQLLSEHEGNISKAARSARKNRRAFWELMRKHHIGAQRRSESPTSPLSDNVLLRRESY